MAHEIHIDTATGRASMMYVGEPPWHGLGKRLEKPATAEQAIRAANLDWTVVKKPLIAVDSEHAVRLPDKFAVVPEHRWDKPDCPVFGIVGKDYTPLQNREAFAFFDPIATETQAIYHTAGALGDGERVWILAKLPASIRVVRDDVVDKCLLLSNSHDGQSSVQIKFTPIRVVCNNTLTLALRQGPTVRVAHHRDLRDRLDQAWKMLGLINRHYGEVEKTFLAMAQVQVGADKLQAYLMAVFPDPQDPEDERAAARAKRDRAWAEHFFANGKGNTWPGVKGTLWAAYNGIAEFVDHRQTQQAPDERLDSVWFGSGYLTKARAYRIAEEKLKLWLN